jgi:hypothetical protein
MRLTWRDGVATVFVAAAAVVYGLWVTGTAWPGVSTRVLGAVVLGLGWAACTINQREMAVVYGVDRNRRRPPMAYIVLASALGVVSLVAGIWALVGANEAMLATLVTAMVALWAMSTVRHRLAGRTQEDAETRREPLERVAARLPLEPSTRT